MALLDCVHCDLTVRMKPIDARAHGWVWKWLAGYSGGGVWICPHCAEKRAA